MFAGGGEGEGEGEGGSAGDSAGSSAGGMGILLKGETGLTSDTGLESAAEGAAGACSGVFDGGGVDTAAGGAKDFP